MARSFAGRRAPVKAALLDQKVVAGVGNIYADEALWAARIHPSAPAGRLSRPRIARLHAAVIAALEQAIEAQGSSIRDFRTPDGGYGSAQERLQAYGRGGEPCERCGTILRRTVIAQRGTTYCPKCQRF
jgi:formamidopyrimidine-DNA glycosylase